MPYRKILVPLDGSKLAELALAHVVEVAAPGANVHILSIMAPNPTDEISALSRAKGEAAALTQAEQWPPIRSADPQSADARKAYLRRVSEWLEQLSFDVTREVRVGSVIDSILDVAHNGFDLIIMVTHGRTGMTRTVLGSVTDALLPSAPCPVLIIPPAIGKEE
jgi:nucleotide-binding universal stress UspA family protein